jgi:adenine phosphoribosyltransferase
MFGPILAYKLNVGFVPVRKPGKLPSKTVSASYDLEYGSDTVEMHEDAIGLGEKVLIVDDLIATGGTAEATRRLVEEAGGSVAGFGFIVELDFLNGREKLDGYPVESLIHY